NEVGNSPCRLLLVKSRSNSGVKAMTRDEILAAIKAGKSLYGADLEGANLEGRGPDGREPQVRVTEGREPGWREPGGRGPGWRGPGWRGPDGRGPDGREPQVRVPEGREPGWREPGGRGPGWRGPGWREPEGREPEGRGPEGRELARFSNPKGFTYCLEKTDWRRYCEIAYPGRCEANCITCRAQVSCRICGSAGNHWFGWCGNQRPIWHA